MKTRAHVVAKRHELPTAFGGVEAFVRVGCLACGGGFLAGCALEEEALELVEAVRWHEGCRLGLECLCGEPGTGLGERPAECFQFPRCGGLELARERELALAA